MMWRAREERHSTTCAFRNRDWAWRIRASPIFSMRTNRPGRAMCLKSRETISARNREVWMERVTGKRELAGTADEACRVVNSGNTSVTAQIPSTETLGLYAVWVINNGVEAGPVFVNQAQSWGAVDLAGHDD